VKKNKGKGGAKVPPASKLVKSPKDKMVRLDEVKQK
jgi:hypothetical protein